jgi:integrase
MDLMNKLSDMKLRKLVTPGKHFDGGGLYLEVTAAGGRYWRMKYRYGGKEKRLAFGTYPEVTLKEARERKDKARALLRDDKDPAAVRRQAVEKVRHDAAVTLEAVADAWLAHQAARWKPETRTMIRRSLERHVFPDFAGRPLTEIRPLDLARIVKSIEDTGAGETAGRVLQRLKAIYRHAAVHGLIEKNPMIDVQPSELLKPRIPQHRAAMDEGELPAFFAALAAYQGEPSVIAALRLLMLTAVRPGELRGARWDEIDLDAARWRIPAGRMKMKVAHLVPLSRQALVILREQRALTGGELVFPSPFYPGKVLSENTLNQALVRLGFGSGRHTAHGFRALFSTVANEHGHDADVIERHLAHAERNEVRAAYHRSAYMPQRVKLMQWWADFLDERGKGGRVLGFPGRAAA